MSSLPGWLKKQFPYPRKSFTLSKGQMDVAFSGKGEPVLLLHGNPTWGFLYRKVMQALEGKPFQCIAPDLLGFGTSSKPKDFSFHTLKNHGTLLCELVEELGLKEMILVVQDWGGPIGFWMLYHFPERVKAVLMMNTAVLVPKSFKATLFHRFSNLPIVSEIAFMGFLFPVPVMFAVQKDKKSLLSPQVLAAYAYPFLNPMDRIGPLALARMVPTYKEHPTVKELQKTEGAFRTFKGRIAFLWGKEDPILGRALKKHRSFFPHAPCEEVSAGHFLQEEVPEKIAQAICQLS